MPLKSLNDKHEFGFRCNNCCTFAILSITHFFCESIDHKKFAYSCFIVLKKAFDTVDWKTLLDKLYQYGFRENSQVNDKLSYREKSICLFQSIGLKYARMYKRYKRCYSGLSLGPFLFLSYINDMPSASNVKLTLFADDTTVVDAQKFASKTKFQTKLNKICNCCNNKKVLIKQTKCKIEKFGRDNIYDNFSFGNNVLAEVSDFRSLGVQMDNRLKFESHINNVCGK